MCGRFGASFQYRDIKALWNLRGDFPDFFPRYNIAPSQDVPVIVRNEDRNELKPMRWGLVPSWSPDTSVGQRMINARAETLLEKPSFEQLVATRRCLVPADGFYEWRREGRSKVPMWIYLKDRKPFAFPGLWDCWLDRDTGSELYSFTIITTRANALVRRIHDRMPVIYDVAMGRQWLDGRSARERWVLTLCSSRFPQNEWKLTRSQRSSIRRRTTRQLAFSPRRLTDELDGSCRCSNCQMRPAGASQSTGFWGIFLLVICVFVTGCVGVASPKKGVGAWYFPHVDRAIAEINVSWFYTWEPNTKGITQPDRVEFVPMIWNETFVEPKQLELAQTSGSVLLGFNEPDRVEQANMTVQQALDLWPHLMATGMRVGSPATASDPSLSGSWLEQFMDGAKARGYRVDFVCVHWYGEEFEIDGAVERLKNFLQAVHQKFQLPIWLTEYSLIRWSNPPTYPSWEQQVSFASKSIDMLETLPFVERYAWFSLPPWTKHGSDRTSLYYQDGDLTPVGVAYQKGPTIPPSRYSQGSVASQR